MKNRILVGANYRHFKGGIYLLKAIAKHSETLEELVMYQGQNGDLWVRPLNNFLETVNRDGKSFLRFTRCDL